MATEAATAHLAQRLAPKLRAGDTVVLRGPVGAGKTGFARALIQARLRAAGRMEDVPSPSYTLIQTYDDGRVSIAHADLYRLTDASELAELGLEPLFAAAIVLVEWPERLGDAIPRRHLSLSFAPDPSHPDLRHLQWRAAGAWSGVLAALSEAA